LEVADVDIELVLLVLGLEERLLELVLPQNQEALVFGALWHRDNLVVQHISAQRGRARAVVRIAERHLHVAVRIAQTLGEVDIDQRLEVRRLLAPTVLSRGDALVQEALHAFVLIAHHMLQTPKELLRGDYAFGEQPQQLDHLFRMRSQLAQKRAEELGL